MKKPKSPAKKAVTRVRSVAKVKAPVIAQSNIFMRLALFVVCAVIGAALYYSVFAPRQSSDIMQVTTGSENTFGSALVLDGSTYVIATNSAALNPDMTKGYTVEAWVRPATDIFASSAIVSKTFGEQTSFRLLASSSYSSTEGLYRVNYSMAVGDAQCQNTTTLTNQLVYKAINKDQITSWHHIAATIHPGGKMDVFVDGLRSMTSFNTARSVCTAPYTMQIGARAYGGQAVELFKGQIDEVHVANYDKYPNNFPVSFLPIAPTPASVLLYDMNLTVNDKSNNGRTGTIIGQEIFTSSTIAPSPRPSTSLLPSPTPKTSFKPSSTPTPSCRPRPACLDAVGRQKCYIPETSDMCKKVPVVTPNPTTTSVPVPSSKGIPIPTVNPTF